MKPKEELGDPSAAQVARTVLRAAQRAKRLQELAAQRGHASLGDMLRALYATHNVTQMAHVLHTSTYTVRELLTAHGITVRRVGGARNTKSRVTITPQVLQDLACDGVPAVAERLGISDVALRHQLKQ